MKKLLILPPVLVGLVVLVLLVRSKRGPERKPGSERATPVQVVSIVPRSVVPTAIAYGTVAPGRTWQAVAEVSGQIESIAPHLKTGQMFPGDTELLRIDDTEYRLEVARVSAEADALAAQIDRLAAMEANDRALLEIERRSKDLARVELDRLLKLRESETVSETTVDVQRRQMLTQEAAVTRLENSLRLVPSDRKALDAQLAAAKARLEVARLNLSRTVVTAPFPCRIVSCDVERTQSVSRGQTMLKADGVSVAEIEAQLPLQHMRPLVTPGAVKDISALMTNPDAWARLGLAAKVRMHAPGLEVEWDARFVRMDSSIDPVTRTLGVVVAVDGPYEKARPGARPPLVRGMFVEVVLTGRPRTDRVVIPRVAIHEGRVYVMDGKDRLAFRTVEIDFVRGDDACLSSGLAPGDRLVLTDLVPAIAGMLLVEVQ